MIDRTYDSSTPSDIWRLANFIFYEQFNPHFVHESFSIPSLSHGISTFGRFPGV